MALIGKMANSVYIKSDGDVFHGLFREKPHEISTMTGNIQNCDLHEGEWGKVGSVIFWNYTHDGQEKVAKEIVEAIDEANNSISFRVIDGDLLKLYKSLLITVHVDTAGDDNLVTWTLDYEKLNETVEYPTTLMDFCIELTKHIETHHLK